MDVHGQLKDLKKEEQKMIKCLAFYKRVTYATLEQTTRESDILVMCCDLNVIHLQLLANQEEARLFCVDELSPHGRAAFQCYCLLI